jgi:hypothetical protein
MSEPLNDLSRFILGCVLVIPPVAWLLVVVLKRRWGRVYDGREAGSEEMLGELKQAYAPLRRTVIRTQTEYLPFLFECIRENIDEGFEDPQVISLLERIQLHKPGQQRGAVFAIVSGGKHSDLHMRWTRDACDRIELKFSGTPKIIRALREYRKTIPASVMRVC